MTALIIEDEIPAGKRLEKLLAKKGFVILNIIVSVKNAVKWLQENSQPEIIFVDIKLRDGNSFEIFNKLEISSKLVFTTAYDEFALKAFEQNTIDYLLKPIDEKKLDKMLAKLNQFQEKPDFLPKQFDVQKFNSSFLIAVGNSLKKIDSDEIMLFFSEDNTTFLSTNQRRNFPINKSLEKLEQELNPDIFFRISRKHLINRNYICRVSTKNQLSISLENHDEELPVSKLRMKRFLEWFKK